MLLYELYAKKCGLDIVLDGKSDLHLTKFLEQVLKALCIKGFWHFSHLTFFLKNRRFRCAKKITRSVLERFNKKHFTADIKNP